MKLKNTKRDIIQFYSSGYFSWRGLGLLFVFLFLFQFFNAQVCIQPGTRLKIVDSAFVHSSTDQETGLFIQKDSVVVYIARNTKIYNEEKLYWKGRSDEKSFKVKSDPSVVKNDLGKKIKQVSHKKSHKKIVSKIAKHIIFLPLNSHNTGYLTISHQSSTIIPVNNDYKIYGIASKKNIALDLSREQKNKKRIHSGTCKRCSSFFSQYFSRPPPDLIS